jgi:hypothetical protein
MELITHFYVCWGAALHQGHADVELMLWLTLTLTLTQSMCRIGSAPRM